MTMPRMQWATGLDAGPWRTYAGWLIRQGQDAALDAALPASGATTITIRYGGGTYVRHWALPTVRMLVLTTAMPVLRTLPRLGGSTGLVFRTQAQRPQVAVHAQILLPDLWPQIVAPLHLTVTGRSAGAWVAAVGQQAQVLAAADALLGTEDLHVTAFSIPIGSGPAIARASERAMWLPQAQIPEAIDRAYLAAHATPPDRTAHVAALLAEAVRWSEERMKGRQKDE